MSTLCILCTLCVRIRTLYTLCTLCTMYTYEHTVHTVLPIQPRKRFLQNESTVIVILCTLVYTQCTLTVSESQDWNACEFSVLNCSPKILEICPAFLPERAWHLVLGAWMPAVHTVHTITVITLLLSSVHSVH
jgi:hypothetical protein